MPVSQLEMVAISVWDAPKFSPTWSGVTTMEVGRIRVVLPGHKLVEGRLLLGLRLNTMIRSVMGRSALTRPRSFLAFAAGCVCP